MTLTKELLDVELFLFDMDGTVYIGDKESRAVSTRYAR